VSPKVHILWIGLLTLFATIWVVLPKPPPGHAGHTPPPNPAALSTGLVYAFAASFVGLIALAQVWKRWQTRRLLKASRLLVLDDLVPAERAYRKLSKSLLPFVAAQAELVLARLEERRANFEAGIALCDKAIGRVAKSVIAGQMFVPMLQTERASLLAMAGRSDDATSELASLVAANGGYPFLASSQLRVRLIQSLRAGDLPAARDIAAQRTPDMPLPYDFEILADIVSASGEDTPLEDEVQRIRDELGVDPALRQWLGAVWPDAERVIDEMAARAMRAPRVRLASERPAEPSEVAAAEPEAAAEKRGERRLLS
jgi:hypothetical protein